MEATPPTTEADLAVGTDVGSYLIETKIGEGGMGIVYGARHPRIGKKAAIKVLGSQYCRDPSTVERFEQEARLVNEIRHPNIVDIFMFGELADGRKYIAMEWLEGESLSDRIERSPISPQEAIDIIDGICDALEAVHEKQIIHRDLKSDNVFLVNVRGRTQVKLLDFGLAKLAGNDPRAITKTKTGIVVGTPHYMAPEQARGKPVDGRSDIYALGVLAYKILTGHLPFKGEGVELLIHHLKTPPPSPSVLVPSLPPQLSQLVLGLMDKEPDRRPTLAQIRSTLAATREGRNTAPTAAAAAPAAGSTTTVPWASSGPSPALILLIALGVIGAGLLSFFIVRSVTG
jgi:eukaryotic-like serine/threonine-protein kinase